MDRCAKAVLAETGAAREAWSVIQAWKAWKNMGVLPWPGAMGDQPAWFVEALQVVEEEVEAAKARRPPREIRIDDGGDSGPQGVS